MKSRNGSYELNVLVGGRAITEYLYEGRVLVQGRKGSEFEVEFKNHTDKRLLVVPAVDNKSVLDGKTATPDSMGYVVQAHGTVRIPGWTLDNKNVANFTFEDKDRSYAAQTTSDATAVQAGVVGVLVFAEKVVEKPQPVIQHHHHHYTKTVTPGIVPYPAHPFNPLPGTPWPYGGPTWNGAVGSSTTASLSTARSVNMSDGVVTSNAAPIEGAFEMGTAFGKKAEFNTNSVKFQKGDLQTELSIYYDSRRNLEKRGIQVASRETRYLNEFPSAFSGVGCQPPKDWQG